MSRCWYYAMPGAESEMGKPAIYLRVSSADQREWQDEADRRRAARLASYPLPASPTHEQKRAAVDALIDHVKVRDGTPLYVEIEWRV